MIQLIVSHKQFTLIKIEIISEKSHIKEIKFKLNFSERLKSKLRNIT